MLPASHAERGSQTTMEEKKHTAAEDVGKVPQTYVDGKFVAPPRTILPPRTVLPPTPTHTFLTPEETKSRIEEFTDEFRNSHRFRFLSYLFEQGQQAKITKCICLYLGHFLRVEQVSNRIKEVRFNGALHQLAMLELILKLLAKETHVQVYFQDIKFTEPERDYLQSCGYTVLQGDSIFSRMSTTTFLFAPFKSDVSASKALARNFPALYIGIELDGAVQAVDSCEDEESFPEGKETYVEALQGFKRVSLETAGLPIFSFRVKDGVEKWSVACVHWMVKKKTGLGKEVDDKGKRASRTMLTSSDKEKQKGKGREIAEEKKKEKEKEEEKDIDWWSYDPTKRH